MWPDLIAFETIKQTRTETNEIVIRTGVSTFTSLDILPVDYHVIVPIRAGLLVPETEGVS